MANDLQTKLDAILADKTTNLLPENIKKGVTVLGVDGALESSSNDIKLFSTIEDMNADIDVKEGDLAVVYDSTGETLDVGSIFQVATFPEQVNCTVSASVDMYDCIRPVDSSHMLDIMECRLTSGEFGFRAYTDNGDIYIRYTGSNNTYTRTAFRVNGTSVEDGVLDFGFNVKITNWDELLNNFFVTGKSNFDGIFKYTTAISEDIVTFGDTKYQLPKNIIDYDETVEFNNMSNILRFYSSTYVNNMANSCIKINEYTEINGIRQVTSGSLYFIIAGYPVTVVISNTNETRLGVVAYTSSTSGNTTYIRKINFNNNGITDIVDYSTEQVISNFTSLYVNGGSYILDVDNLDDTTIKISCIGFNGNTITIPQRGATTYNYSYVTGNETYSPVFNTNILVWQYAPTQLNLTSVNQLLPGITGYGKKRSDYW